MENVEIKVQEMDYSGTEAYKSLRTNLQFCGEDKKVIAVTSCTPNEGKSSVTMNLAVSMAEAGKKVILIDADMRKSVLVGRTKVRSSVKGLTHYLSKQAPLIDVICSTNVKNLSIIFADRFRQILQNCWEAVILKRCWIPSKKYMITY